MQRAILSFTLATISLLAAHAIAATWPDSAAPAKEPAAVAALAE